MNDANETKTKKAIIHITFNNGEVWEVDVTTQAWERAKYYADQDLKLNTFPIEEYHSHLLAEFEHSISDEIDMIDHVRNSVDWSDISDKARLMTTQSDYDYASEFTNNKAIEMSILPVSHSNA